MKEITPLLEGLAERLGTTVEYLWSVMVGQAPISACIDIFQYIILGIITYFFIKITRKYWLRGEEEGWDGLWIIIPTTIGFSIGCLWIVSFLSIHDTITGFVNPEYWALEKILNMVGK